MIFTEEAFITQAIIHKVGNKHNDTDNTFSNDRLDLEDEAVYNMLFSMSLRPFEKQTDFYHFTHSTHLSMNEMLNYSKHIFQDENAFIETSQHIVTHLFEQSTYPQIKTGDVIICHFADLQFEGITTDAIAILKIERKTNFFQTFKEHANLNLKIDKGINPTKIDKGCLILNTKEEQGYKIISIDNNNYDAAYWKENFLNIDFADDANAQTKNFLDMCKSFSNRVVKEDYGKQEQAQFLSTAVNYFAENETVNTQEFEEEVFVHNEIKQAFVAYKDDYENKKDIDFWDEFDVSQQVLESQKRKLKNEIKLDTKIQIKLDINSINSSKEFMERGFDEEKQMYYYKVFFNNEL